MKLIYYLLLALALMAAFVAPKAQSRAAQASVQPSPKTADEAFKNIQVLKGIPADQLIPSMQFITASLGVECDFCHVQNAFEKDDKKPKQTARKMVQMMFAINKENFEGHREVTCYSCHRGHNKPLGTPVISDEEAKPEPVADGSEAKQSGPTADQLLDKYAQALGGAAAVNKISSRSEKGVAKMPGGREFPIEILVKAPDKRKSIMHLPNGDSITGYDGHKGWLEAPGRPPHEMSAAESQVARLDADLHLATEIRQIFNEFKVDPSEKVGDRETNVVTALREGQPPVKLYFDKDSGLLLRMVRYAESPLGLNPSRVDYENYRNEGGVMAPFRWTIARPGGRFTIQVSEIQLNLPLDDSEFQEPPLAKSEQEPRPVNK
jgi:photosynthetic reaction center cytochrome c subunit